METAAIETSNQQMHYQKIAKAIEFIRAHQQIQPSLKEISDHIHMSEFHTQRIFSEWAGVSPKQYLQYLTKEQAKRCLVEQSVNESALNSGLSGSSRLHDLMITWEGMTPGEFKQAGNNLVIEYGICDSPFGDCFIAWTERGLCRLVFLDQLNDELGAIAELEKEWPKANLKRNNSQASVMSGKIFQLSGVEPVSLHLLLKGTPFQLKVWEALLAVPEGRICTYEQMARSIDAPNSTRAVASAIARNNIGWLIPCHRVIRKSGELSNYRWGTTRKAAMIARELSHHQA